MGVSCLVFVFLFYYAVLCVSSNFSIISLSKRELAALIVINCCYMTVSVLCRILTVPWVCLQCVIVAFPSHTHLLYGIFVRTPNLH